VRLDVNLTDQELDALEILARGRQIKIAAGIIPAEPEDRAIAKVLLAGRAAASLEASE
jgi:hypothetical protein